MKQYVVVGAGIVGCTCALTLAQATDAEVVLIGKMRKLDRTFAINRASEALLNTVSLWNTDSVSSYTAMSVRDVDTGSGFDYQADSFAEENLGYMLRENTLLTQCRAAIERSTVCWQEHNLVSAEKTDSGWKLSLQDGSTLTSAVVIAADGKNSLVCKQAGFQTRAWDSGDVSIVCNVTLQQTHEKCAFQWFTDKGIVALLPLAQHDEATLVWSVNASTAEQITHQPAHSFGKLIRTATLGRLGDINIKTPIQQFAVSQHQQKWYYRDGVVCIGDAAHAVHPLAGQGLNMGLRDCLSLAVQLAKKKNVQLALFHYQQERQLANTLDVALMTVIRRTFRSSHPLIRYARQLATSTCNKNIYARHIVHKALYGGMNKQTLDNAIAVLKKETLPEAIL